MQAITRKKNPQNHTQMHRKHNLTVYLSSYMLADLESRDGFLEND